jgi:hypothetical protein
MSRDIIQRIADGRTDLVFDWVADGHPATATDPHGAPLSSLCAYYGDVSAIRFLLSKGESLESLGDNFGLNAAVFHGHWQRVQFLLEQGADANHPQADTGETPLHAALCKANRPAYDSVLKVLLAHGASPNVATKPTWRPARSCAIAERRVKRRSIALPPSAPKRLLRSCSTPVLRETPRTRTAIRRCRGRVGICAPTRFCGSSATAIFSFTRPEARLTITARGGESWASGGPILRATERPNMGE